MLNIHIQINGGDDDDDYDDHDGDAALTIIDWCLMIDAVDENWSVFCVFFFVRKVPHLLVAFASFPEYPSSRFHPCQMEASSAQRHRRHPSTLDDGNYKKSNWET